MVSAGFMKLVGEDVPAPLRRALRQHPPGAARRRSPGCTAPADALAYGVKVTGATLFVVDDGVDTGPIVAQAAVAVEDDDTVESLHERIKVAERALIARWRGVSRRAAWSARATTIDRQEGDPSDSDMA